MQTNEAASLSKKTINQRKINGTSEAMAKSARSHETLELITGENELREILQFVVPHYVPLIIHSSVLINQNMTSTYSKPANSQLQASGGRLSCCFS